MLDSTANESSYDREPNKSHGQPSSTRYTSIYSIANYWIIQKVKHRRILHNKLILIMRMSTTPSSQHEVSMLVVSHVPTKKLER